MTLFCLIAQGDESSGVQLSVAVGATWRRVCQLSAGPMWWDGRRQAAAGEDLVFPRRFDSTVCLTELVCSVVLLSAITPESTLDGRCKDTQRGVRESCVSKDPDWTL